MSTNKSLFSLMILASCLVLSRQEHVISFEEYEKVEGEDFCSKLGNGYSSDELCAKIAKINKITGYDSITRNESCYDLGISLISEGTHERVPATEKLLRCEYNHKGKELTSRVLGRGKGKKDVMEYQTIQGHAYPLANRESLLAEVSPIITLEEHTDRKGKNFCTTLANGDGFEKLCIKTAKMNEITGYDSITGNKSCCNKNISLYSSDEGKAELTNEDVLICEYNPKKEGTYDNKQTDINIIKQLHKRALGRGKKEKDVIEYEFDNNGIAYPMANRVDMLKQVVG